MNNKGSFINVKKMTHKEEVKENEGDEVDKNEEDGEEMIVTEADSIDDGKDQSTE